MMESVEVYHDGFVSHVIWFCYPRDGMGLADASDTFSIKIVRLRCREHVLLYKDLF